ncbi:hypothetical protein [Alicyclobacillus fastidiosus]|uniref:hypothetical protein n=1 Tax=Alicyclobacillus fastidiosus TaxID=392011 RepID=UPI0023E9A7DA|nr:hypothetical protein [Alicyclobacillus fastidiosus]GMA66129.1 hypothetical protein GCM10025859_65710 [Alicyclobacillus fastidiosus]
MKKVILSTMATIALLATPMMAFAATSMTKAVQSNNTATHSSTSNKSTTSSKKHTALSYKTYSTEISYDGMTVSKPLHIIATDPWSKKSTSWLPIYYLDQALSKTGVHASWDDSTYVWNISAPTKNWKLDLTDLPKAEQAESGRIAIHISNKTVEYAPRIVALDPYSHVQTTYVPVSYIEKVLTRAGFHSTWNGTDWTITR